jgi:rare lipoprotein A
VVVEIIDRGPVSKNRIMDLSKKAAQELDFIEEGIATVDIEIAGYGRIDNRAMLKHFRNIQIIKLGKILI